MAFFLSWLSASLGVAHQYQNKNSSLRLNALGIVFFIMSFLLVFLSPPNTTESSSPIINSIVLLCFWLCSAMLMSLLLGYYTASIDKNIRNKNLINKKPAHNNESKEKESNTRKAHTKVSRKKLTIKQRLIITIKLISFTLFGLILSIALSILIALHGPFSLLANLSCSIILSFPIWVLFSYSYYIRPAYVKKSSNRKTKLFLPAASLLLILASIIAAYFHLSV